MSEDDMRLTHRQLEIFHTLMHTLNVTTTAQQLYTSQPTISRELREIEQVLGFPLFYRDNRRLEPTQQAIALNIVVQRSFVSIGEIMRSAQAIKEDRLQRLSIACLPAFAHALMPLVLQQFLSEFPGTSIKIHSLEESALTRDLVSKFFDLGVVEGELYSNTSSSLDIVAGDLMCILPADHRLTKRKVLRAEDFTDQNFIYYSDEDSYRRQVDLYFTNNTISRRLLVETTTATSIGPLVRSGIGISIVNPLTALAFHGEGIAIRPLAQKIPYRIRIWQPQAAKQSPYASRLINVIETTITNINRELMQILKTV